MKRPPNDCETSSAGPSPGEEQILDLAFRERRTKEKQKPEKPADKPGDRRHGQPGRRAPGQHDERGNSPAVIPLVAQARDAHEQDQGRNDRDEEQNMIEIDHDYGDERR